MPAAVRNGTARRTLLQEAIRLSAVAVIALAVSYWGLTRNIGHLQQQHVQLCQREGKLRENQRTVLLSLLGMLDILQEGTLTTIPAELRGAILGALANLPEQPQC